MLGLADVSHVRLSFRHGMLKMLGLGLDLGLGCLFRVGNVWVRLGALGLIIDKVALRNIQTTGYNIAYSLTNKIQAHTSKLSPQPYYHAC